MIDLTERLPRLLRKVAQREADEGEYEVSEHIDWMAADRIEELQQLIQVATKREMSVKDYIEEMRLAGADHWADEMERLRHEQFVAEFRAKAYENGFRYLQSRNEALKADIAATKQEGE